MDKPTMSPGDCPYCGAVVLAPFPPAVTWKRDRKSNITGMCRICRTRVFVDAQYTCAVRMWQSGAATAAILTTTTALLADTAKETIDDSPVPICVVCSSRVETKPCQKRKDRPHAPTVHHFICRICHTRGFYLPEKIKPQILRHPTFAPIFAEIGHGIAGSTT